MNTKLQVTSDYYSLSDMLSDLHIRAIFFFTETNVMIFSIHADACIHLHVCTHMYTSTCMYTHVYIYMTCMQIHVYIYMYVHTCIHLHDMHADTCIHLHVCTHMYTSTCMYTHACTHTVEYCISPPHPLPWGFIIKQAYLQM